MVGMTALHASLCQATVLFHHVPLACVNEPKELVTILRLRKEGLWMAGMAKAQAYFHVPCRGFLQFLSLIY